MGILYCARLIATILVLFANSKFGQCSTNETRIIIIGAGPSGIAAAAKLIENGYKNVTILEAEDRIGGRVYTTELGNFSIDLGGQWVHGEQNVVFDIAYPLGVLDKSDKPEIEFRQEYVDSQGEFLDSELVANLLEFYDKFVDEGVYKNHTPHESIGAFITRKFNDEFKNESKLTEDSEKYLLNFELAITSLDPAESWNDVSASSYGYEEGPGDLVVNWKHRGYSTILDILMKKYPDPAKELPVMNSTVLGSEVVKIDYSGDKNDTDIIVTTSAGQIFRGDHVIVTVSLGVLKERHATLFVPPLPVKKVKTIEGLGFGAAGKIFLLFEEPFWDFGGNRRTYLSFLWNSAQRASIETDPERLWLLGMIGVSSVEYKPNLLMLWISARFVKMMENLPEEKVLQHATENLERFLGKKYNVTKPIGIKRTQWASNPHFRGSYSFRSVKTEKKNVYAEDLGEPLDLKNLPILFAGEATSKNRYGTVDGAIGSGWKAANAIMNHHKSAVQA
ncbi:hypothetical protein QAD02_017503 [Eretmocerus hayati]|uniref:Uncharacterized protein n=1 Tax=Eretmocerus hayati TaxID=131215 RepID=A0ACC2PE20_9HYME|nr:hypothetical protein QAD02_017503 [Eretmocerus hayati]